MRISTSFEVAVPPDRVAAYLADPRHLFVADHDGPIIERSDGALAAGSWFVLAFDQLRVRIEYTAYDPPHRIAVTSAMTGRGSRGTKSTQEFVLSEALGGRGTHVDATVDGDGGWPRWGPLMRASQALTWRRMRQRMEASAQRG